MEPRHTPPPRSLFKLALACASLAASLACQSATVSTSFSNVGGTTWDVNFTVGAHAGQTVQAFSVYFDWAKVSHLLVQASPAGWDSLAFQADSSPSDGYFDALALGAGIAAGSSLAGFTARFDWADATAPASLRFTVNDPVSFATIESGFTVADGGGGGGGGGGNPSPVPEPSSWALLAIGLLPLMRSARGRA